MQESHVGVTVSAVDWLLESDEPGIVAQAKRALLDEQAPAEAARVLEGPEGARAAAPASKRTAASAPTYAKWGGAHWRLVSLVEPRHPGRRPRCLAAAETVLDWLTSKGHRGRIQVIDGLTRRCGSQEGNALAVCSRLGIAEDPRVTSSRVARRVAVAGRRLELRQERERLSLVVQRVAAADVGAARVWAATGETGPKTSADRTAELFLEQRPLPRTRDRRAHPSRMARRGALPAVLALRGSPQALLILSRTGKLRDDPRAADGIDILLGPPGRADGCWHKGPRPGGASRALRAATSRSSTGAGAARAR